MRTPLEAPSVNDAAIPGFEYATWFRFVAPAKVPAPIVARLASAFKLRGRARRRAKLLEQGIVTRTVIGRRFRDAYMKADLDRLTPIIKSAGIGTPER